ncbi:MAG: hypothetical protein GY808_17615, partial [Gammaproteobacteria bacterium]|nr:hypothetical protein [Gammaproteobacteria bacterium]
MMKSIKQFNNLSFLIMFFISSLFAIEDNESIQIEEYSEEENFISSEYDSLVGIEALRQLDEDIANQASIDNPAPIDETSLSQAPIPNKDGGDINNLAMAAVSWDGGAGTTSWNDADNWSNDIIPSSADDITLASGDYVEILTGANGAANSISIQSGATLIIGAKTLTVDGTFAIDSGGNLSVSGSIYIGGDFTIDGSFTANSNSFVYLNGAGSQNISGASFFNLCFQTSGTKTATGNLDVDGAFRIYSSVSFDPSSHNHTFAGLIENDGIIILGTGSINLDGTGNQSVD